LLISHLKNQISSVDEKLKALGVDTQS